MSRSTILIGYSGHAFVAADIICSMGYELAGYCEREEKKLNPFGLSFYGSEDSKTGLEVLKKHSYFIAIGDNHIRQKVSLQLATKGLPSPMLIQHPSAVVGWGVTLSPGVMIGANASINALASIGQGVICNTGCIIEHECQIGDFVHIAPGAVLAGNVEVGEGTFIGANTVIKQGIKIGKWSTIGAGSVIIKDIPEGVTIIGNPGRKLR